MKKFFRITGTVILILICALLIIKNYNLRNNDNNSELTAVKVLYVVDGDTLRCTDDSGEDFYVRLNLIDTPESVSSDASKNNEYGVMAGDYVKGLVDSDDTVWLQYDEEKTDKYGRTLAYVWLSDDVDVSDEEDIKKYMLNCIIIENGYCNVVLYNNRMYYDLFSEVLTKAKEDRTGLWQYDGYRELTEE